MTDLAAKRCLPCEGNVTPLDKKNANELLKKLNQWEFIDDGKAVSKTFKFKNYYSTIAFVNAVAWIAQQENHHPDLTVSYSQCIVRYSTHAIDGLSENDFICAAKVDRLLST